jgi:Shikimate 5-dehydrogenase
MGDLVGHNTDIVGFEKAIKKLNFSMKGKKVLVLGAGGVVPSIIFCLKKMHVSEINISNRTLKKAENLKILFDDLNVIKWGTLPEFDVIINATSLGLFKEEINLDFSKVGKDKLFYDVIYNPKETNFLKKGKECGNISENGKLMFVYQASEAFKLWHGIEPEINTDILNLLDND